MGFRQKRSVASDRRSVLGLLIVALVLGGCEKSDSTSGGGAAPAPIKELRLAYFANATHAQAVLGVDSGEFAKSIAPATVSAKMFNAGPSLIEALFAGEVDIGYVGPGPVLSAFARSNGEGIRVISGAAANGVIIVARKDSGIVALKELAGKRIATPQMGNTQDIAARHYLSQVLGQEDLKTVRPTENPSQSGLMSRGDIDASWAPEPWGARLVAETGATIIAEEKDLWPDKQFSLTVVVTTPEFLKKHPDVVQKILTVHHSWTKRLNDNPKAVLPQLDDALFKLTNKKLPAGVLESALPRVKFTDEPLEATFNTMAQWAYDLGFSKSAPKLDGLFDLSILKKAQATSP